MLDVKGARLPVLRESSDARNFQTAAGIGEMIGSTFVNGQGFTPHF
jgi:hypothetical protein